MLPQQHRRRRRRTALPRAGERRVVVARGAGGFGFTIAGQRPCVVSAVAAGGPAELAGLRAGDALLTVAGAAVARAPHGTVARLVARAPQTIALSVAPRVPTDTEDTEPDERARHRRRHVPPRRRLHHAPLTHHPGCQAAPSSSTVNELLHNLSRVQLSPSTHVARLECRVIVGYLGTIETPRAASETPPGSVKTAVRKLRQERRPAANVLLSVLPNVLILRRPTGQVLAEYARERIIYAGCSSDAERRYFGLVTAAELEGNETEVSYSCHVFAVDSRLVEHEAHNARAREFQIACTRDPVAERCLEFPPSAEYVVGVVKGMYSLPPEDCPSPALQQLSKLAIKGDSPAMVNFSRCNRAALRMPRNLRRPNCRHEENARFDGPDFVANSPQPSNHSEVTTTSSNSDSGIGFHNDGRNIAERILVVEFAGQQPLNPYRGDAAHRPLGMVGCNFEDASFLSNTTPVVDGFGGQGRPLNHLDDVILNANEHHHLQGRYNQVKNEDATDSYNYNNLYSNLPSTSKMNGAVYNNVNPDGESHYELIAHQIDDLDIDTVTEDFDSVEIIEEQRREIAPDTFQEPESVQTLSCQSYEAESTDNVTVISGATSKVSMDSVSVYSSRSHEEPRPSRERYLQASLDDMLVLGLRDEQLKSRDEDGFLRPASIKCKVRKGKPTLLSRTREMLARARRLSASQPEVRVRRPNVAVAPPPDRPRPLAASEPDLDAHHQSEQSSPFRRWTTGSGGGSSYRHHDHRNIYNKQMSDSATLEPTTTTTAAGSGGGGGVARWALGLEHLLADPAGAAAFAHFLQNEFASENIRFWWSCEQYRSASASQRGSLARAVWSTHLAEGAPDPVNVDAAGRRAAQLRLHLDPPPQDLFLHAQKQIFNVMKFDSYPRFLRSSVHAECARAGLLGQPSPYIHNAHNALSSHTQDATKLKKSASNASERRRSGGVNLLPWKLRAASKDRAHCASANNVSATEPCDVVKSAGGGTGCSLCRLVLPDGATSVVGVDDAVTVRQLVDRVLLRRNIQCTNYDVLLRDAAPGENSHVNAESASTSLGGRAARVERRAAVRVWLGEGKGQGRAVALRCGAARPLRHALHPLLQGAAARCYRDGQEVCLDTLMQELDGSRLEVVVEPESECGPSEREDEDSLSELATRLQVDGDAQSSSGAAGTGTRVRAALRGGAPLHRHPTDFLEALRVAQKQRSTRGPAGDERPPPPPPPPLPPKPSQPPAIV